ncbi:DUF485 domain-containing protein [Amycolatopsis pithecellobii]|uniref:DUF485 domain-containing protein n=1 Tax=Amycolatopsis pithecellobii TaxID=664692 RepID=A0A6N7Z190_9PSEU|nr:DUF485 domain-containing protein [Amycolatopsis pithecellobii]MTD55153.1 DUF485 domain-containing protein [Amycolatopsis pithecellobii]
MTSPTSMPYDDAAIRLAAELRRRRRRLVVKLGLPSLACYLTFLALMAFGQGFLRAGIPGGLSVGWVVAAGILLLPWIVCALFARGARRTLDSLRAGEAVAAREAVRR